MASSRVLCRLLSEPDRNTSVGVALRLLSHPPEGARRVLL